MEERIGIMYVTLRADGDEDESHIRLQGDVCIRDGYVVLYGNGSYAKIRRDRCLVEEDTGAFIVHVSALAPDKGA